MLPDLFARALRERVPVSDCRGSTGTDDFQADRDSEILLMNRGTDSYRERW